MPCFFREDCTSVEDKCKMVTNLGHDKPSCHTKVDKCPNAIIKGLKDGEHWVWPESDYGKAEIWKINDTYFLFSIPMYGGQPQFEDAFTPKMVEGMISLVEGWT